MTIEVKQLLVKSTVLEDGQKHTSDSGMDEVLEVVQSMREEILAECKDLLREILREERER